MPILKKGIAQIPFPGPALNIADLPGRENIGTILALNSTGQGYISNNGSPLSALQTLTPAAPGEPYRVYTMQVLRDFNLPLELVAVMPASANIAPSITINGDSTGVPGVAQSFQAIASDSDGTIAKVELCLMANSTPNSSFTVLDTDLFSPYVLSWTPQVAGNFYLRTRATDDDGAVSFSSALNVAVVVPVEPDPATLPFDATTSAGVREISSKRQVRELWANQTRPAGAVATSFDGADDQGQPVAIDPTLLEYVVNYRDAAKQPVFSAIIANTSKNALTNKIPFATDDQGNNVTGSNVYFGFRPFNCISIGKNATKAYFGQGYTEGPQSHGAFALNDIQTRINYQKIPGADRLTQGTCYQAQNDTLLFHLGYDGIDGIETGLSGTLPGYFRDYKSKWFLYAVQLNNPDQRVTFSAGTNYAVMQGERPQVSYNGYQFNGRCTGLAASDKYVYVSLADTNEIIVLDAVTMAYVRTITSFVRPGALLVTREGSLRVAYQDPGTPNTTPVKLTGQGVGAAGYGDAFEFSIDKAFDGNPNTYYATSANITHGWLGMYVGQGVVITGVELRPSDGREADCMGWIQLSNANNLDDARDRRTVYQIATKPVGGQSTRYDFTNTRPWSYVRVFNPGKPLKVADMTVWGYRLTDTQVVANFTINSDGTLTESGPRLSGHQEVTAITDDAAGNLYTREGGSKQAVCRYSKANGGAATATWTQADGVKFYFTDAYGTLLHNQESPAPLACAPDGSVWVGDTGNERLLHLSTTGTFVEAISYSSHSRSAVSDSNDPTCFLGENREYTINVDTLAWKLKFPWSQTYNSMIYRYLKEVATLSNGRRYAVVAPEEFPGQPMRSVVEMVQGVGVRFTPTILPWGTRLESDGSLLRVSYQTGQPARAWRRLPTGFDANNNPQWGSEVAEAVGPTPQNTDPHFTTVRRFPNGGYVVHDASRVQAGGSPDYHIAGWHAGNNYFDWKGARATSTDASTGPYPLTGRFDTRANLQDPGGPMTLLVDKTAKPLRWFVWCYMGEGWNGKQCCYFHVVDADTGLLICVFGSDAFENPPSMTSVVVNMSFVRLNDDVALLIVNEEGGRGFPVWKLTGLSTGNVIVKPVVESAQYSFTPAESTSSRIDPTTQEVVSVSTSAQLKTLLSSNLTNKKIVMADGTYTDNFEQTGTWTNVWLTSASGNTTIANSGYSVLFIFQGTATRNRVRASHINFNYTGTGNSYALMYWNELGTINGLEIDHCSFSCPNGNVNALGCSQYSVASTKGGIAKDVYIHHNDFPKVGRIAIELLNQGYDQVRLTNLRIDNNTFGNLGLKDGRHGMAISLSGLIQRVGIRDNVSTGGKYCIYELVNCRQVIAENNSGMSQDISTVDGKASPCAGWSISKDTGNPAPREIYISGGNIDVAGRPFQAYDAETLTVDGGNQLWKGHRSVQMNVINSLFKRLNLLIQSSSKEASLELTKGTGNTFRDSKISSAGSAAAGFLPAYETVVARPETSNNSFLNLTTELGLQSNNEPFAPSAATGADGRVVDQGTNNTVSGTKPSVVA